MGHLGVVPQCSLRCMAHSTEVKKEELANGGNRSYSINGKVMQKQVRYFKLSLFVVL